MSKVKIQGHASGTGVLTITAPNTSTDRTITLPDATGTLLNSDGDGSSLTGISSVGGATGVDFNDDVRARFGTGNDLNLYHDGSNSYISDTGATGLIIKNDALQLARGGNTEKYLEATANGSVDLYHNNNKKFETTADGIELQGKVEINSGFEFTAESGSTRMSIAHNTGNVWIDGNCSAASFTDRTPYPETLQLAYDVINSHKKLPDGQYKADDQSKQLDHSQLNEYVSLTTPATLWTENDNLPEGVSVGDVKKEEEKSRNMSGVISCLVEVIKDLSAKITALENA
jgi:hypothetical protein